MAYRGRKELQLREAFRYFDTDQSGAIGIEELSDIFKQEWTAADGTPVKPSISFTADGPMKTSQMSAQVCGRYIYMRSWYMRFANHSLFPELCRDTASTAPVVGFLWQF